MSPSVELPLRRPQRTIVALTSVGGFGLLYTTEAMFRVAPTTTAATAE